MKKLIITFIAIMCFGILIGEAGHVMASATHIPSNSNPAINARSTQEINAAFNSPASNLRIHMNNLMHEHAAMGAVTLTALYEGADTTGLMQQLNTNQNQIAAQIQTAYGTTTSNTFVQLWSQHMQEYQNYTLARKNKDAVKMNTAMRNLHTISNKLGTLLAGSNQNISATDISTAMQKHVNGTLAIVDAVAQGNATQSASLTKAGYDQAGNLADVMTRALLLQNPNAF